MFWQVTQQLLEGFESTLKLFCITLVAALPLGLIISFGSMSKFRPLKHSSGSSEVRPWCSR